MLTIPSRDKVASLHIVGYSPTSLLFTYVMSSGDICEGCEIRDSALCGSLSDVELATLNKLGRRQTLARGASIMWTGEDNVLCANLVSGVLKLVATTPDGREQIVGLLYPADFVGQPYAERIDFTITALTDSELCIFPRKPFENVLEGHARMERLLLQRTLATLSAARGLMLTLARKSAAEKVAGFLLDMELRNTPSGCGAKDDDHSAPFDLPLSRGQIADVLGLTIETVSRQMTRLKGAGLITLPGGRGVAIADHDALSLMAETA